MQTTKMIIPEQTMKVIITETIVVPIPLAIIHDLQVNGDTSVDVWDAIEEYILPSIAHRLETTVHHVKITGRGVKVVDAPDIIERNLSMTHVFDTRNLSPKDLEYYSLEYDAEFTP